MKAIEKEGKGVVVYINTLRKGNGMVDELKALGDKANSESSSIKKLNSKDFGIGAQILRHLNISKMRLLTNNPIRKIAGIEGFGLSVTETVKINLDL